MGRGAEMGDLALYRRLVRQVAPSWRLVGGVFLVGLLASPGRSGAALSVAGWSFLVGTLIFSGTLYALALTGIRWLGAITPIGGIGLIVLYVLRHQQLVVTIVAWFRRL